MIVNFLLPLLSCMAIRLLLPEMLIAFQEFDESLLLTQITEQTISLGLARWSWGNMLAKSFGV